MYMSVYISESMGSICICFTKIIIARNLDIVWNTTALYVVYITTSHCEKMVVVLKFL